MLKVVELVVRLEPRAAILQIAGAPPRSLALEERSVDRVVDSLCLLLDALALSERPTEVRIDPDGPQVVLAFPGGSRVLSAEEVAQLPERALAGPLAVARREAGDAEADEAAGALASEPSFWRSRYREQDLGWDLGAAAPPLVRAFQALTPCRAVVVGCGQGHEVRALAKLGFDAVGVDFAPEAVERARALTAAAGLQATFVQADVLALPGALGTCGLWVEHTCFCAIDPARRSEYVAAAERTLLPGGELVGLFYAHGRAGGPPYRTTEAEVRRRFQPGFEIELLEVAADSVERRRGEELLGRFRRRSPSGPEPRSRAR
jgi:SAM-dependent methyltransferase